MKKFLLIAACTSLTACSGHLASTQISELDDVRAMIAKAKSVGAETCAPALQAKAVAKMHHAAHEINDEPGMHPEETSDLVASARTAAKKAYEQCKPKPKPAPKPVVVAPPVVKPAHVVVAKPATPAEPSEIIELKGINFPSNSAELTASSKSTLENAVKTLQRRADIKVEVAAHSDSRGKASYNRRLSDSRANSVMNYLISRGIDASRLTAKGYGEEKPIADNATAAGRAKNRRVELRIP